MESISKKKVLVVGATGSLGKAIAYDLKNDFDLVIHGRTESKLNELSNQFSKDTTSHSSLCFDISDRDSTKNSLLNYIETNDVFYGVCIASGISKDGPFVGFEDDDWDCVLKCNLDGFYNVLRPILMPMIRNKNGGRIVVLSSLSGLVGKRGQVNYSASKAGLIGAVKALSKEVAKKKITVNCVAPGFIESEMTANLDMKEFLNEIPMKRAGKPEEVASLVSFLMSEKASYITGQTISINGGII